MKTVHVKLSQYPYQIYIQTEILSNITEYFKKVNTGKKLAIITDRKVYNLYTESIINSLKKAQYEACCYIMPVGENYKSQNTVNKIYQWLLEHHFSRDITIIAIGGGVVGDLAGFIASTYLRGVKFIQIPTTLLSQVDSSVGGKVGINHRLGKNVIGAFYHPKLVLIDPSVLITLPKRELYCGLAEVVKYGFILDKQLTVDLLNNFDKFIKLSDWDWVEKTIARCCQLKTNIVEEDEKESGLRRILNYGHTIGHALESATDYKYFKHGEAVSWGMLAASEISFRMNYINQDDYNLIQQLINKLAKPAIPPYLNEDDLHQIMLNDKKMTETGLHFVLLEQIGKAKTEIIRKELLTLGINRILQK